MFTSTFRIFILLLLILSLAAKHNIIFSYAGEPTITTASLYALDPQLKKIHIGNQGRSPKCTVNAVCDAIEQQMIREGRKVPRGGFSEEWLWSKIDHSSEGANILSALEAAKTYGLLPVIDYDTDESINLETAAQYKIADYHLVDKTDYIDTISSGAIIIVSTTYQEKNWKDGILTTKTEKITGLHATYLVQYDKHNDFFVGINSWGTDWGYRGMYYMEENYLESDVLGGYTVELNCMDSKRIAQATVKTAN